MSVADSERPPHPTRRWALALWLVLLALLSAGLVAIGALRKVDHSWHDAVTPLLAVQAAPESVTIIDIDERSLQEVGPWPWPRPVLAPLRVRLLSPPLVYHRCVALRPLVQLQQAHRLRPRLLPFRLLQLRVFRVRLPQLRLAKCSPAHTSSSSPQQKNAGSTPVPIKQTPVSFLCARATPLPLPSARVWNSSSAMLAACA